MPPPVQVFREVAVLDRINPGAFYSSRIKLLHSFQRERTSMTAAADHEITDPLYGDGDETALLECIASLRLACRGLLTYLLELKSRWDLTAADMRCNYLHVLTCMNVYIYRHGSCHKCMGGA